MTLKDCFMILFGLAAFIAVPAVMVWSVVQHYRTKPSERRGGGGSAGLGAALQELDRLAARPSVEHIVEAQRPIVKREDDQGGE